MADTNSNGKWQIAFWIMAALVIGAYSFTWAATMQIKDAIVCNDRIRQEETARIKDRIEMYQKDIIQRLARMEERMRINNG